jgi:hypothetical protein
MVEFAPYTREEFFEITRERGNLYERARSPKRKEQRKAYGKVYRATPERRAYLKAYRQTPEHKAYKKAYNATPERKAYDKARNATPERKEHMKEYNKAFYARKKLEAQK